MSALLPRQPSGLRGLRQVVENDDCSAETLVDIAASSLIKRQITGAKDCAEATALLLRRLIDQHETTDMTQLLIYVHQVGRVIMTAQPKELTIGNMVRRVQGLIRDEIDRGALHISESGVANEATPELSTQQSSSSGIDTFDRKATSKQDLVDGPLSTGDVGHSEASMFTLLSGTQGPKPSSFSDSDFIGRPKEPTLVVGNQTGSANQGADLKSEVLGGIEELLDELRQADDQIAAYAPDYIGPHDNVLTNSTSKRMTKFLLKAASRRHFTVFQVLTSSNDMDHVSSKPRRGRGTEGSSSETARKSLVDGGLSVTLVPETAIFALMPKVSKVLLEADSILIDGSFVGIIGTKALAKAARYHRTPISVLGGVYQISPQCVFDDRTLLRVGEPGKGSFHGLERNMKESLESSIPSNEYLHSVFVDLYVSNLGGHSPGSICRVVSDHYRIEDCKQ